LALTGQVYHRANKGWSGEIAIGLVAGTKLRLFSVEVAAPLLGSLPLEDLLTKPVRFAIAFFVASTIAIFWKKVL
jgi:hypothetical protein